MSSSLNTTTTTTTTVPLQSSKNSFSSMTDTNPTLPSYGSGIWVEKLFWGLFMADNMKFRL